MLHQTAEKTMHRVRWGLTIGWFILIGSLFYDPISSVLTDPQSLWSPIHLNANAIVDPKRCVKIRETCIEQSPYAIGTVIWWSIVVPSSIFILLVFGHEFWRRICPLSFLSQIPRALGIQRKRRTVNPATGIARFDLVKIGANSWLGQNHLYVQFGLFIFGLGLRILLINGNRVALGCFLLFTIGSAITVGYLYAGKSWCQYFCPMAPVQLVYTGPRSLLGSPAYLSESAGISQSMCRITDPKTGAETSACVGCKATCFDIDAEKHYWQDVEKPGRQFVQYGYFGMVVAFYLYYYLYAGNWNYFFSGAWTHEDGISDQPWEEMMAAGFYIAGHAIPIPKLFAVFITFAVLIAITYTIGILLEKLCRKYVVIKRRSISAKQARHIVFTVYTIAAFWTFFSYGGRPLLNRLPTPILLSFNALIVIVGSIWLFRTVKRQQQDYDREAMTTSLRKQVKRLDIVDSTILEGRTIEDLNPDELHMLVKVLPGFSEQLRHQTYKGVLLDCLEQQTVNLRTSFAFCEALRRELQIDDALHFDMLAEIISNHAQFTEAESTPTTTSITPTTLASSQSKTIAHTILKRIRPIARSPQPSPPPSPPTAIDQPRPVPNGLESIAPPTISPQEFS